MKQHTKTNLIRIAVVFGLILIVPISSCKKMDDKLTNRDTKKLNPGPYVAGSYLTSMMQSIIKGNPEWWQQVQQNLNADLYSGYFATGTAFRGGSFNATYNLVDGWNNFAANTPYDYVLNSFADIKKETKDQGKDMELYAISLILKVSAAHRLTDIFGPIPYTKFGTSTAPAFDSQEEVYNAFFSELKEAIDILTTYEDKDMMGDQVLFAPYDVSTFGGDFKLWVQYANTLRLRLAIRISKANSGLAKTQGELSTSHKYGVLEKMPFGVNCGGPHYLLTLVSWTDVSLNANMECFLNGYKDPRASKYATPATAPASVAGTVKGIRNGIDLVGKSFKGYSFPNVEAGASVILMTAAESYFLRAEGTLRGWNMGGSEQSFYEGGIAKSFDQYGLSGASSYYSNSTFVPTDYVDVVDPANNISNTSNITIRWEAGDSFDKKLERIITQKWIANYPEGQEAWSEFRRTTYPKLFPVVKNDSQGEIAPGKFIRRLRYPSYFTTTNPSGTADAIASKLGGPDKMSTPLWWDKN